MDLKYLIRFRYYRRILLTIILIGIVVLSISIVGLTVIYDRIVTKQVGIVSTSALEYNAKVFENLMNDCKKASESLIMEKTFQTVAGGEKVSRLDEYGIMQEIYKIKSNYPYILHMGIINGRLNRYVGTRGIYFDNAESYKKYLPDIGRFTLITRTVSSYENTPESPKKKVISFIYEPHNYQKINSCIIIDMDYDEITELFSMQENNEESALFFLDKENEIAFYALNGEESGVEVYKELIKMTSFEQEEDWVLVRPGRFLSKYLLAYHKLEYVPWNIISIIPDDVISGSFLEIRMAFILLGMTAILMYIFLSLVGFRYIYRKKNSMNSKECGGGVEEKQVVLTSEIEDDTYFYVVNFCMEELGTAGAKYGNMRNLSFALNPVIKELFSQTDVKIVTLLEEKSLKMVCHTNQRNIPFEARMAIEELIIKTKEEYKIQLYAGCSKVYRGKESLTEAIHEAGKTLMQKVVENNRFIFYAEELDEKEAIPYPNEIERKLLDNISKNENEMVNEWINRFFDTMRASTEGQRAIFFIQKLFLHTCYRGDILSNSQIYEYLNDIEYGDSFFSSKRIDELKEDYMKLCSWIMEVKQNITKVQDDPIGEVIQYIDQHYDNPEISITYLADLVHLNSAYMGQLFAKTMGMNCNEYLLRVRMQAAEKMLVETDLSIQSISEKVGIINNNYFYTLFRKHYGMTPLQYRKSKN